MRTNNYAQYLQNCCDCGAQTSKSFARANAGRCKACSERAARGPLTAIDLAAEQENNRNARMIDSGYAAYAREEGHYDHGDF